MHAYLAHRSQTSAEIRIRLLLLGSPSNHEDEIALHTKPHIELKPVLDVSTSTSSSDNDKKSSTKESVAAPANKKKKVSIIEVKEDAHTCQVTKQHHIFWRCVFIHLTPNTKYIATLSCHENVDATTKNSSIATIYFTTLSDENLGRHCLRLGILADAHVNNYKNNNVENGKRLYQSAKHLLAKYAKKLVTDHHVDHIVLPGDVCDTGVEGELRAAAGILKPIRALMADRKKKGGERVHCIIGNHERNLKRFAKLLVPSSPEFGYYSITTDGGVHLIMLATNTQDCLNVNTDQYKWLEHDLEEASSNKDIHIIILFLHYSLVLHPLHNNGLWDDGLQLLDNASDVLKLIHLHHHKEKIKMVVCGHKNVPSALVDDGNVLHTLSPQLIQVPCGYDVIDIYERGCIRCVYEIEEMELQEVSRVAAGEEEAKYRWGEDRHRSFKYIWGAKEIEKDG